MNDLVLPSGVDKLSKPQKIVAGGLAVAAILFIFYFVLPPMVVILANLWLTILLGLPLVFIIKNPELVWGFFKTLSWKLTQKLIGLDVLSVMDRYLDWLDAQVAEIKSAKVSLAATLKTITDQISERENAYQDNLKRADISGKNGNQVQSEMYASRAVHDKEFLESMVPMRDDVTEKVQFMAEVVSVLESKREGLKYSIETNRQKFTTLKTLQSSLGKANKALSENSDASKLYNESVRQLTTQMNTMTATIEEFKNTITPAIAENKLDKQLIASKGAELLAQFRATNLNHN